MSKKTTEQYREYRLRNLEKVLERDRQYRLKNRVGNPEYLAQSRVRNKEYYENNKESVLLRQRLAKKKPTESLFRSSVSFAWQQSLQNIRCLSLDKAG